MLIGCIPNARDFRHPADRRRSVFYFERKKFAYELADFEKYYPYLYVSISADLGMWSEYRNSQAQKGNPVYVMFDLSDAFFMSGPFSDAVRAVYHFCSGRTKTFSLSYKKMLFKMIEGSDVVLCGSSEQKAFLDEFHPKVVVLRDYFEDEIRVRKSSYELAVPGSINVFWEGFSHGNIAIFKMLKDILHCLPGLRVNLHIVTDSEYCRVGASHLCRPTYSVLKEVFAGSDIMFHLYDWNEMVFSSIATSCDFAVIPIPDNPVMRLKPENKLLLLWSLGLPVLTSNTPSYERVMRSINADCVCANIEQWRSKVVELALSKEKRERYMDSAALYIQEHCAAESITTAWDGALGF